MTPTLFHYVHCPFCIRVRMAFGYLDLPFESKVVAYDDEKTPLELTGVKMLPALKVGDNSFNESLDIIALIDGKNQLKVREVVAASTYPQLEDLLARVGNPVHSLAMPYWIWTPEFTPSSRHYFQEKKEKKRGPFKELVQNQAKYLRELAPILEEIEASLSPYFKSPSFGLPDILIASHIWGLYVVPEFQFSPKLHDYLQRVKAHTKFNYHKDFWS